MVLNQELIIENLDLVPRLVHLATFGHVGYLDRDDIMQSGYIGLIKAAQRYDDSIGEFRAYASSRVIGSMKDTVRTMLRRGISYNSLDDDYSEESETTFHEFVPDENALCPCEETLLLSEKNKLNQTMELLPARCRYVLHQYYWNNKTLDEIAVLLHISPTRACQLHKAALRGLRLLLKEQE